MIFSFSLFRVCLVQSTHVFIPMPSALVPEGSDVRNLTLVRGRRYILYFDINGGSLASMGGHRLVLF